MWLWANSSKIESVRSYEHYLHHRVSCLQKLSPAASTTSVLRLKNFWTIKNLERVRENQRVSQMWIVISASLCEFTTDKPFLVSYLFHVFFSSFSGSYNYRCKITLERDWQRSLRQYGMEVLIWVTFFFSWLSWCLFDF